MQNIKTVIDVGSGQLKTIVIGEEEGKRTTLYKNIMITKGIHKGKILEPQKLEEKFKHIIQDINKTLGGEYVDEYVLSISHPQTEYKRVREQKRIIKDKITNEDIKHLSTVIADIADDSHLELLKITPIYRIIDNKEKVKDPQGLPARTLDIVADIFYIPKGFYEDLVNVIESVDMYVVDIIPNILATTEAAIDYETKDLGCVAVDIGKEQTSFVICEDGYPIRHESIPIGGDAVTRDISIGMKIDIKEAEQLKIQQGSLGTPQEKDETTIDKHFLNQIITARYEEIFEKVNDRLRKLNKDGRLAGGIILSGGGSKAKNIANISKDIFQLATFAAEDVHMTSKEIQSNMQFINVLGAYSRSEKHTNTRKGIGMNFQLSIDIVGKLKSFFQKLF